MLPWPAHIATLTLTECSRELAVDVDREAAIDAVLVGEEDAAFAGGS